MKGKELNMELTVYNPQKGKLETIEVEFKTENTTWFEEGCNVGDVLMITDYSGGLLIKNDDYTYPVFVYDLSRAAIGYSREKAKQILQEHE
jgi:ATP-dependent Clp protease adapter protein ClpS